MRDIFCDPCPVVIPVGQELTTGQVVELNGRNNTGGRGWRLWDWLKIRDLMLKPVWHLNGQLSALRHHLAYDLGLQDPEDLDSTRTGDKTAHLSCSLKRASDLRENRIL